MVLASFESAASRFNRTVAQQEVSRQERAFKYQDSERLDRLFVDENGDSEFEGYFA